jgi:hypothetical protein
MPYMPQESYDGCLGLFDESLIVARNGATTFLANASGGARFVAVEFSTPTGTLGIPAAATSAWT